jgi:hypothetical protein
LALSFQLTAAATALALVGHFLPLPAPVTGTCMAIYMLCAYAGAGFAMAALVRGRPWALAPMLVCGFFLIVQWYWFWEWLT